MEAPRACKCGKELLPAETSIRSGIPPKATFGCADCGATLGVFAVDGGPDLEVWLDEWSEEGGKDEPLSVFLKRELAERNRKSVFSTEA